jgi:hypothetical protein
MPPSAATVATANPAYSAESDPPEYRRPQAQAPQGVHAASARDGAPAEGGVVKRNATPATPPSESAPSTSGQMAVPAAIAFPCQNDEPCGLHHCNLQYGKCAFPCASAVDCIAPNECLAGICVPAPSAQH